MGALDAVFLQHLPDYPLDLLAELLRPPLLEQLVGFLVGGVPEAALVLRLF